MRNLSLILVFSLLFSEPFLHMGFNQESSQEPQRKKEPLSESSKKWLDEVVPYIITKAEKEFFLSLPNEIQRGKFIESFWKSRDPNPDTPENEFKVDYYTRVALANKFFGSSGIKGWRTDRGKVYIMLGPPNDIQREMTPTTISSSIYHGPKEIWNYWGLQNPRLPYNLEFVFIDKFGTGDYVLEQSVRLAEAGGELFDLNASHYYFDYMETLVESLKNPYENMDKLRGIITTQVTYDHIPFDYNLFYFRGPEHKTHIPLTVKIPYSACMQKEIEGVHYYSLTLMVEVSDKLGRLIFEKSKDINIKHSPTELEALKSETINVQTSISLEPESYKIHLLILDDYSGKIGTIHKEFSVPEFGTDKLHMSDIILYSLGKREQEIGIPPGQETPGKIRNSFKLDEEMTVYFEVYNLTLDPETGTHDFKAEYEVFHLGQSLTQVPSQASKQSAEKDVRITTSFKLRNFKPGDYILRVKVTDSIAGSKKIKDIDFSVTH